MIGSIRVFGNVYTSRLTAAAYRLGPTGKPEWGTGTKVPKVPCLQRYLVESPKPGSRRRHLAVCQVRSVPENAISPCISLGTAGLTGGITYLKHCEPPSPPKVTYSVCSLPCRSPILCPPASTPPTPSSDDISPSRLFPKCELSFAHEALHA